MPVGSIAIQPDRLTFPVHVWVYVCATQRRPEIYVFLLGVGSTTVTTTTTAYMQLFVTSQCFGEIRIHTYKDYSLYAGFPTWF